MMSSTRLSHSSCSSGSLNRVGSLEYWTDDLPVCPLSGIGSATNQIYRDDGLRREEHEFEDRSFHFKVDDDMYLYGVFDGHEGSKVSNFATQRMPAELLFGQLNAGMKDCEVQDVLRQAFLSVEKAYCDSIDDIMAEKYKLQLDIPEGVSRYDAYQHYPDLMAKLEAVEQELMGGTTAIVALVIRNRLFVANSGCCRALLIRSDNQNCLRVTQLSSDHDLNNIEERERLKSIGVNVELLQQFGTLGNHQYTRTMGDYLAKNTYSNLDYLKSAQSDPVVANPEIQGGIELDSTCSFLVLMSKSLYKSIEDALGAEHVNREIASMVAMEFSQQSTLNGVAQAVVDKVVRLHHDTYMTSFDHRKQLCQKREDIMLLVRNFNFPLPNAMNSPSAGISTPFMSSAPGGMTPLSISIPSPQSSPSKASPPPLSIAPRSKFFVPTTMSTPSAPKTHSTTISTSESDCEESTQSSQSMPESLVLDENGRVQGYVSFAELNDAIQAMTVAEKEAFDEVVTLTNAYETIAEEELKTEESHTKL